MTETEKIRTHDRSKKAFAILAERTQLSLTNIEKRLDNMNKALGQEADADDSDANLSGARGE